jgi:hypothetical protein
MGIVQLKEPSFGVVDDIVWTTAPALSNSIFTYDPAHPEDVQAIAGVVPRTQDSPPFGEVTTIDPLMEK